MGHRLNEELHFLSQGLCFNGLVFSFPISKFFVDAPSIPCLIDLVHAFNRVVVEQFNERF